MPETLPCKCFNCLVFLMFSLCFVTVLGVLQRNLVESYVQNDTASDDNSCSFSLGYGYGWMPETLPFKLAVFILFSLCFVTVLGGGRPKDLFESDLHTDTASDHNSCSFSLG